MKTTSSQKFSIWIPTPLAFLALFSPASLQAGYSCSPTEISTILNNISRNPVINIVSHPSLSQTCKINILDHLTDILISKETLGLCPNNWCPSMMMGVEIIQNALSNLPENFCQIQDDQTHLLPDGETACLLKSHLLQTFQEADALIAEAVETQIETIESKINQGFIPSCLVSKACLTTGPACQDDLWHQWWQETIQITPTEEYWISEGSFDHLVLADAFICNAGQQKGPSCALYSAVNLMNHYCQTPQRWSEIQKDKLPWEDPPIQCPSIENVLEIAHEQGLWPIEKCHGGNCVPILENPRDQNSESSNIENSFLLTYSQEFETNYCRDEALYLKNQTLCDFHRERIEELLPVEQARILQDQKLESQGYPDPGTRHSIKTVAQLSNLYRHFGYLPIVFSPLESGWKSSLKFLKNGRPIQLGIFPENWFHSTVGADHHAVVLIGHWNDSQDESRVMILDSMDPHAIKIFPEKITYQEFLQSTGALGLCVPSDPNPFCHQ